MAEPIVQPLPAPPSEPTQAARASICVSWRQNLAKARRRAFYGIRNPNDEMCIEIVSEASRHIPDEWKEAFPLIPWKDIANIGNFLRHAYDDVDVEILWNIYLYELDALEAAIAEMAKTAGGEGDR